MSNARKELAEGIVSALRHYQIEGGRDILAAALGALIKTYLTSVFTSLRWESERPKFSYQRTYSTVPSDLAQPNHVLVNDIDDMVGKLEKQIKHYYFDADMSCDVGRIYLPDDRVNITFVDNTLHSITVFAYLWSTPKTPYDYALEALVQWVQDPTLPKATYLSDALVALLRHEKHIDLVVPLKEDLQNAVTLTTGQYVISTDHQARCQVFLDEFMRIAYYMRHGNPGKEISVLPPRLVATPGAGVAYLSIAMDAGTAPIDETRDELIKHVYKWSKATCGATPEMQKRIITYIDRFALVDEWAEPFGGATHCFDSMNDPALRDVYDNLSENDFTIRFRRVLTWFMKQFEKLRNDYPGSKITAAKPYLSWHRRDPDGICVSLSARRVRVHQPEVKEPELVNAVNQDKEAPPLVHIHKPTYRLFREASVALCKVVEEVSKGGGFGLNHLQPIRDYLKDYFGGRVDMVDQLATADVLVSHGHDSPYFRPYHIESAGGLIMQGRTRVQTFLRELRDSLDHTINRDDWPTGAIALCSLNGPCVMRPEKDNRFRLGLYQIIAAHTPVKLEEKPVNFEPIISQLTDNILAVMNGVRRFSEVSADCTVLFGDLGKLIGLEHYGYDFGRFTNVSSVDESWVLSKTQLARYNGSAARDIVAGDVSSFVEGLRKQKARRPAGAGTLGARCWYIPREIGDLVGYDLQIYVGDLT